MLASELSVSAIVPLYNGARYIEEALRSIFAQHLPPAEVIVVDDGSTDEGPDIVRRLAQSHPLTLLNKENGGQSSARNFAIRRSSGALIALLDQDDAWYPNHLSELIRPFREDMTGRLGWTYSNLDEIGVDGQLRVRDALSYGSAEHPKVHLDKCLQEDLFILPTSSLILREAFDEVGGFDERLQGYEDDDLFLRLFSVGYRNAYIDQALARWRIYPSSASYSPRMARSRMIYARKLLDAFPDQPMFGRYYSSKLLAPRFLKQMADEASNALARGDVATAEMCLEDMAFLERKIARVPPPHPVREQLLVSAVVLLRNGAATIRDALHSVQRQNRPADEIIVVDDGSTDEGPAIVEELAADRRIRLVRKPPGTIAEARNEGVRHAHGDVVAFLDQGDLWHYDHVGVLLEPFVAKRAIPLGWSHGDVTEIDAAGSVLSRHRSCADGVPQPKRTLADCLNYPMQVIPSAAMISRAAYWAVGGCDVQMDAFEDDDLFIRLFRAGYDNVHFAHPLTAWRSPRPIVPDLTRIALARRVYYRKLEAALAGEPGAGAKHFHDLAVPRFFRAMLRDTRTAIMQGSPEQQAEAIGNLRIVIRNLPARQRILVGRLLLPALDNRLAARLVTRHRVALHRLVGWLF
ncbi:glycosyltransferase family A protein [Rhodopila sp.]|jgi:glycosyltransferase involved in cell wall biosynthesis|uniref:glycosyltransferase family A protein n=1 Tax=Rhodopila sp. TaxID=2480087 RepID=UPI002C3D2FBE|nr:glycosyltransferase family A protein [Rhodopila sp.]HVZ10612.1 glycosyltransferase family A protein [Rhodopila sp.]